MSCALVSFPTAVRKHNNKYLREKELQNTSAYSSRQQGLKQTQTKSGGEHTQTGLSLRYSLLPPESQNPPTLIKVIKKIPHRHVQKPNSQVILGLVEFTAIAR